MDNTPMPRNADLPDVGAASPLDGRAKDVPRRRTQAERSTATRAVLLKAAVGCLYRHGYGATTTINVANEAGVSRGAMLHQFPSKADLMAFVVEETFAQDLRLYRRLLRGIDTRRDRLIAYPEAAWRVLSRPAGVAVIEILQGSRSDHDLKQRLSPILARIEATASAEINRQFPAGASQPLRQLIVGAVRGLAMMNIVDPDDEGVRRAIPLLQALVRAGVETGLFSSAPASPVASAAPAVART
ncbi:TetR/AcrR family transcriptional regulator [Caulobacter sp. CCNWLY153]|uniref:TetR/AcrR family transcriptional regulator n=1 Tax=unclassified Caulobacter TaxID=2648921 RepID=UPI0014034C73